MMATSGEGCCPPGSLGALLQREFTDLTKAKSSCNGSFITVGRTITDTPCYYVAPELPIVSSKAMILFPDVWGFQSRILEIADWLCNEARCHVLICDFFRGETKDDHEDMKKWFESIPYEPNIAQDTAACMNYLKSEKGINQIGAMGFCWGGWAIAKSYQAGNAPFWQLVISPHPSFKIEPWVFGGDDVALMQSMTCPVLLMPAGNDPSYTKPDSREFQNIPNKESKSIMFEDMVHGWTTRGDMTDPKVKRDVEAALTAALDFVQMHL